MELDQEIKNITDYDRLIEVVKEVKGFDISTNNCLFDKDTQQKVEVSLEQIVVVLSNCIGHYVYKLYKKWNVDLKTEQEIIG